MVKDIVRDTFFLSQKAAPATEADAAVGRDLLDTLSAHRDDCVGMAANMIGVAKAIIAIVDGKRLMLLYNPVITKAEKPYETEEGCLSLTGKRPCTRYGTIEVKYQDDHFHHKRKRFTGFTAEIVQHEVDHLGGKII